MTEKRTVLGKELILSQAMLKQMFQATFGENLLIQDVWYEPKDGIHMKVAKIGNSQNLVLQGFKEVTDPSNYEAKEKIDERMEQLVQCEKIIGREW